MAEMFGVDTPDELLTDEERRSRMWGAAKIPDSVPIAPAPTSPKPINRPGDVTPGIGQARADIAAKDMTPPDIAPATPPPAPLGSAPNAPKLGLTPPPPLSPSQQIQAEPRLGGWKKGLETVARAGSQLLGLGGVEQTVERAIPGSDANRAMRLGDAQKEEDRQLGLRKSTADIAKTEAETGKFNREPAPKAEKDTSLQQGYADAVQDAINRGVDPNTDSKVLQIADTIQRIQKDTAPKPDTQTQNKERFQNVIAKVDKAGLPSDPKSLPQSLNQALKRGAITQEEHQAASGYLAANPTPSTTVQVSTAGKLESQEIKDANTYYRWTGPDGKTYTGKGGKVPKGADAEPIGTDKDYAMHLREGGAANIVQQSLNRVAQDIDEHPEIFDNAAARDIMATTLEQIDRASAGILVAGTGGSIPLPSGMGDMINTALQNNALDKKTSEALKQYIADYKAMKDKGIVQQMEMQGGRIGRGSQQAFSAIVDQIPNGKTPDSKTAQRQIANLQATQDRLMKQYRDDGKEQPYKMKSGANTGTGTDMEYGTWKGQKVQRPKGGGGQWQLAPAQQ